MKGVGRAAVWLSGAILVLSGCAGPVTQRPQVGKAEATAEIRKQEEVAFRTVIEEKLRLIDAASRIEAGGAELCGAAVRPALGLVAYNRDAAPKAMQTAAHAVLGVGKHLSIIHVTDGLPAAAAGLRAGDRILSLDGRPAPEGPGAVKAFLAALAKALQGPDRTVTIEVERERRDLSFEVAARPFCAYPVVLDASEQINAQTDGKAIHVNRGLMRFAKDDELALVLSHELAHDVMEHVDKQRQNMIEGEVGGLVLDVLAAGAGINTGGAFGKTGAALGSQAYSQDFEAEADYVGLYIFARAGYPIDEAPNFWRRMATVNPRSIQLATTHPSTAYRFIQLEKTVAEIKAKEASGAELRPEMRKAPSAPAPGAQSTLLQAK